jgi:CMP-N-acetylneuraminic acid synthetase
MSKTKNNKVVAIVPIKSKSERIQGKNFTIINKKQKLYEILLNKLGYCNFDEIYVDTDSSEIKEYCLKKKYKIVNRLPKLAKNSANGNDLLNYHGRIINSEIYFQLFVTAPLLSIKTINDCINILKKNKKIDSIFTAKSFYTWYWFNKKPVNYNPQILPRSQDCKPVIQETTGLYGIRRSALIKYKARIGKKPYFYEVPFEEAIDIDENIDLKYLHFLLKQKF